MTAIPQPAQVEGPSLIARLSARLRPEFATPVILVDPSDPVMGGPGCRVGACERVAVLRGMCSAHHQRWAQAGRPEAEAWAAAAPAVRRWLAEPPKCAVGSCRRAHCELGLCHSHAARWRQDRRPDRARWVAEGGGGPPLPRTTTCRFPGCGLDGEGSAGLCQVHRSRWVRHARPPVEAWLADCAMVGRDRFDLRALPMPMRLEIAYAIQRRVEERRTKTPSGSAAAAAAPATGQRCGLVAGSNTRRVERLPGLLLRAGQHRASVPARRAGLSARRDRRCRLGRRVSARCVAAAPPGLPRPRRGVALR